MNYQTIDAPNLLGQFNGDEEILIEMIEIFNLGLSDLLNNIRGSIEGRDANQLRITAHTFKGIMKNFYAVEGAELAYDLEGRGAKAQFSDALEILNKLEDQLTVFLYELQVLKSGLSKSQ